MDFTLNEEQEALKETAEQLISKQYRVTEDRRLVTAQQPGFSGELWQQLAELGAFGLPFDESLGGVGAGPIEVGIVAEQLGRALAPEPFVEAVVLAGGLIAELGTTEQQQSLLGDIISGEALVAFAMHAPTSRWQAEVSGVTAQQDGDDWVLSGLKEPVRHGGQAQALLVSATTPWGIGVFVVTAGAAGMEVRDYRTHDGGRAAAVSFANTRAELLGESGVCAQAVIAQVFDRARLAYAFEMLGILEVGLDMTVDYLKTRKQFGVPLSSFQALQHRAAELYVALEMARSTILWAGMVLEAALSGDATADAATAIMHACLQTNRAARLIGQDTLQMHGGIGMTAEYGIGQRLSRLTAITRAIGDSSVFRERLLQRLEDHASVDPLA